MGNKFNFEDLEKGKSQGLLDPKEPDTSSAKDAAKEPKLKQKAAKKESKPVLSISQIPRSEGLPPVIFNGRVCRTNSKAVQLFIPDDVYSRLKGTSNLAGGMISLIRYALDNLDQENKTLMATFTDTGE